jgi:DNA sulfur modification protein DndB
MKLNEVIKVEDREFVYYLGTIEPSQILELTFVPCEVPVAALENVLNIRHQGGYQREGDVKRMGKIKAHYSDNNGSLIPPVLLSTRGKWEFQSASKNTPNYGSIEAKDCAAIIDGQHRLGGLSLMSADSNISSEMKIRKIPFMAVQFIDEENEKIQFEIVNDEQKGIPKSHLKFINRGSHFPGMVADAFREAEDSVFCGRIGVAKRADWDLITFGSAEEIVAFTFDAFFCQNAFKPDVSMEDRARGLRIALMYWQAVKDCFPTMWSDIDSMPMPSSSKTPTNPGRSKFQYRLLEETGLMAFAKLGSKVLNKAYLKNSGDIAWETVKVILRKIAEDQVVQLAFQKKNKDNQDDLIGLDPQLQFQGKAGIPALWRVLEGAFMRAI